MRDFRPLGLSLFIGVMMLPTVAWGADKPPPTVGFSSTLGFQVFASQFSLNTGTISAVGTNYTPGLTAAAGVMLLNRKLHLHLRSELGWTSSEADSRDVEDLRWDLGVVARYYFLDLNGNGGLAPLVLLGLSGGETSSKVTTRLGTATDVTEYSDTNFRLTVAGGVEYDAARAFGIGMLLGLDYLYGSPNEDGPGERNTTHNVQLLVQLYLAFRTP